MQILAKAKQCSTLIRSAKRDYAMQRRGKTGDRTKKRRTAAMLYTDGEIRQEYRLAKNKLKQVQILAQLNGCDEKKITLILKEGQGMENEGKGKDGTAVVSAMAAKAAERQAKWDEIAEYIREGGTDEEAAKEFGVTAAQVKRVMTNRRKKQPDADKGGAAPDESGKRKRAEGPATKPRKAVERAEAEPGGREVDLGEEPLDAPDERTKPGKPASPACFAAGLAAVDVELSALGGIAKGIESLRRILALLSMTDADSDGEAVKSATRGLVMALMDQTGW